MDERQEVPPAFYGIYNGNNDNPRVNSDDLEALEAATFALIDAIQKKTQSQLDVFDDKLKTLRAECEKLINPTFEDNFQEEMDAFQNNMTPAEAAYRRYQMVVYYTLQRNELILEENRKRNIIARDLSFVLMALGWDPEAEGMQLVARNDG